MPKNVSKKTFYVTTPIYYINAKPHIGHAYSTIVADVLARWHRNLGEETFFSVGTDEHGAKIAEASEKQGLPQKEFADIMSEKFRECWKLLNIQYDDLIRTTETRHKESVVSFMQELYKRKFIYQAEYEGWYCKGCEKFLTEKELVSGMCPDHKRPAEWIKEKNYFFKLKKFLPKIQQMICDGDMQIVPKKRENEVLSLLKQNLPDFSVSRQNVRWGIPLPFDPTQTIYVWVEALQNYISILVFSTTAAQQGERFQKFWPADVQIIGKEISKFHCIFWPALLLALALPLPKKFLVGGFFTFDGQKMSKSLGNVLAPKTLVERFGVDGTRFLLLSQFPYGEDGDIALAGCVERYNAHLADNVGNLVSRIGTMIQKYLQGRIETHPEKQIILEETNKSIEERFSALMARDQIQEALLSLFEASTKLNQHIEEVKPWKLAKTHPTILKQHLLSWSHTLHVIGRCLAPFLPNTGERIQRAFRGPEFQNPGILFPKIS